MYTLYIDCEEVLTAEEQTIAEVIWQLAGEYSPVSSRWTPMVQESIDDEDGFSVFVHWDTFEDEECNDEEGIAAWESLLGCKLKHDIPFWEVLQKLLSIKVVPAA